MFKFIVVVFILVPLLEIYLLIQVGGIIGPLATICLVMLTAFLGVFLLRLEGLSTLATIRTSLDRKEIPAIALVEGLYLLFAGALLLTPGFFTDTLGFLCLISGLRHQLAAHTLRYFVQQHGQSRNGQTIVIEGEFYEEGAFRENRTETLDKQ